MGLNISGSIDRARHPEQYPDRTKGPTFDPVGFQSTYLRKENLVHFSYTDFLMDESQKVNFFFMFPLKNKTKLNPKIIHF
jgi:hypothetical protein